MSLARSTRAAVQILLLLTGCSPARPPLVDGGWTAPPAGWTAYCAREGRAAGDPSC